MDQVSRALLMAGGAEATDPQFNYVTLLLKGNGTNGAQNNTFLDSSTNNFTITRNGNTTQGTFAPYGANWSNYFDGTGDYLVTPSSAAFGFGTGDFTIEAFANLSSGGVFGLPDGAGDALICYQGSISSNGGKAVVYYPGIGNFTSTPVTLNSWLHIAITRSAGTLRVFFNGIISGSPTADSKSWPTTSVTIGDYPSGGGNAIGYISNLRIVKGTALYTANFTPPTAPLTAITNTSLLTCQSNRFIDNSTNNFTITKNGDVSVQVFSPFSPTASYAAGTIGGSGYFDGNGDYLDVANNNTFDTNSTYTLECWFYQPAAGNAMLFNRGGGTGNWNTTNGYQFTLLIVSGVLYWEWNNAGSPATISVTTPTAGAWHHFAVGYDGTTTRAWVDGASIGTSTTGYTMPTTRTTIRIGADQSSSSSNPLTGYISGFRFVKGTDVYGVGNTTITVPTTPPTAISNTSLLLNFTNGGIIDNAMMNDLETVGNAQISTSVSKFGGGSVALTAAGDYLRNQQASALWDFGTGNWTIEGWIYPTSLSAATLYSGSASSFLILLYSNKIMVYENSTTAYKEYTLTLSTNTWQHIAIVRNGAVSPVVYVNGTEYTTTGGTYSGVYGLSTDYPEIGYDSTYPSDKFYGYLDDLRITKGVARYTANFTPPDSLPTR